MGMIQITEALLKTLQTSAGGFTKAQFIAMGFDLPKGKSTPPSGWRKSLIGQYWTRQQYGAIVEARKQYSSPKRTVRANHPVLF